MHTGNLDFKYKYNSPYKTPFSLVRRHFSIWNLSRNSAQHVNRWSYVRQSNDLRAPTWTVYRNKFDARKATVLRAAFPKKKTKSKIKTICAFSYSPEPTPPPENSPTRAASPRPGSRDADPQGSSPPWECSSPCRRRRRGWRRAPPRPAASCRWRWYSLPPWSASRSPASPLHTRPPSLWTNRPDIYHARGM